MSLRDDVKADPPAALERYIKLKSTFDTLERLLKEYVADHGEVSFRNATFHMTKRTTYSPNFKKAKEQLGIDLTEYGETVINKSALERSLGKPKTAKLLLELEKAGCVSKYTNEFFKLSVK